MPRRTILIAEGELSQYLHGGGGGGGLHSDSRTADSIAYDFTFTSDRE